MTVNVYIAVLLTIIVIALVAGTIFLALALWQVRRAARALEQLANQFGSQVTRAGELVGTLGRTALLAAGGWGKTAAFGAGLVYTLLKQFRRRRSEKKEEAAEPSEPSES